MSWIDPDLFTKPANGVQTDGDWGGMVHNNLDFLHLLLVASRPAVIVRRAPQTVLGAGDPLIAWTDALVDNMAAHGAAAGFSAGSPTRISLNVPGWYLVLLNLRFNAIASDIQIRISRDDTADIAIDQPNAWTAQASGTNIAVPVLSSGGTFLRVNAQQSGATMQSQALFGAIYLWG